MAQKYYEDWKKTVEARKKLANRVLDPDGLLTGNGYVSGVYEFIFVKGSIEISAYIGQAGFDATAPTYIAKDVYERILQHLKRWMGGSYYTYWTGLEDNDEWKIKIQLLCQESNHSKRLEKESEFISAKSPFLQDTQNGKYQLYFSKYGYCRNDLAIHPWARRDSEGNVSNPVGQRRLAFLDKVAEARKAM